MPLQQQIDRVTTLFLVVINDIILCSVLCKKKTNFMGKTFIFENTLGYETERRVPYLNKLGQVKISIIMCQFFV